MFGRKKVAARRGISDEEFEAANRVVDWRADGPFDESEVDLADGVLRQDWGSLIVTTWPGLEVTPLTLDGEICALIWTWADLMVEIQLYADSASSVAAEQMLDEMPQHAESVGGHATPIVGPLGPGLKLVLPVDADDELVFQPAEIWLARGPSWLLRATLIGTAATLADDDPRLVRLLSGFRALVVRRAATPMIPGTMIPFRAGDIHA